MALVRVVVAVKNYDICDDVLHMLIVWAYGECLCNFGLKGFFTFEISAVHSIVVLIN